MCDYLTQNQAIQLDKDLMGKYCYSLSQLMEVAGLSCAQVLSVEYPVEHYPTVFVVCGSGNNGGDGLVAARYLQQFGYNVIVYYPKHSKDEHLCLLVKQLEQNSILVETEFTWHPEVSVILDAIFGFSFKAPIRGIFKEVIDKINNESIPVVSVDIPSGWDVEKGYTGEGILAPKVLVSLSYPKLGVRDFKGKHYIGGRFIPLQMQKDLGLHLPYTTSSLFTTLN
ncbi:hypothetical protein EIN_495510 [Entamoeba invadens IP1]|uniref:NAD(P)H-hydrate epimerase n=1 Tax=Entamoeba invadens IP1 TaxID=370355 RepID=A0A0A1TZS2_ENTIV|nr:hypothetical protein EIN_495510 [Entamoeba invadens IP1]ELP87096.1 hypothetical protein EIN_495510 [Entamoeba invadens IP1]|eukprot:XP_004253867.1 hypothetical protein EIN_495510 [Entamoeba invadens IP1]